MTNATNLVLRIGLAFAFAYPAIAAYFAPLNWIGYFPQFMKGFLSDPILLHTFGISEIVLAVWILSGKKLFIPSALASLYLLGIVVFNINSMDIVFRDISILAMSVALAVEAYGSSIRSKQII